MLLSVSPPPLPPLRSILAIKKNATPKNKHMTTTELTATPPPQVTLMRHLRSRTDICFAKYAAFFKSNSFIFPKHLLNLAFFIKICYILQLTQEIVTDCFLGAEHYCRSYGHMILATRQEHLRLAVLHSSMGYRRYGRQITKIYILFW